MHIFRELQLAEQKIFKKKRRLSNLFRKRMLINYIDWSAFIIFIITLLLFCSLYITFIYFVLYILIFRIIFIIIISRYFQKYACIFLRTGISRTKNIFFKKGRLIKLFRKRMLINYIKLTWKWMGITFDSTSIGN